jgi:Leucine-rich repeat (LRR) protein
MFSIFNQLKEESHKIVNLRVLTLSRLGFDRNSVKCLAEAIVLIPCLEQLDISGNNINPVQMSKFFEIITGENNLKSLNISFNNCNQQIKDPYDEQPTFDDIFSEYLHLSTKLVHVDISGTNLVIDSLRYIAEWGFRKSRTLQSIHICDLNLLENDRIALR